MTIARRSFFAGLGAVTVGLLIPRLAPGHLGPGTERDSSPALPPPAARPTVAEVVVRCEDSFRPERLVVAEEIAPMFAIDGIEATPRPAPAALPEPPALPAGMPAPRAWGLPSVGEIRFRVRYVGDDPRGLPFRARLVGRIVDSSGAPREVALPVDSVDAVAPG